MFCFVIKIIVYKFFRIFQFLYYLIWNFFTLLKKRKNLENLKQLLRENKMKEKYGDPSDHVNRRFLLLMLIGLMLKGVRCQQNCPPGFVGASCNVECNVNGISSAKRYWIWFFSFLVQLNAIRFNYNLFYIYVFKLAGAGFYKPMLGKDLLPMRRNIDRFGHDSYVGQLPHRTDFLI